MNRIGLKLWNVNTDFYFNEAIKLYESKIFDYIELYIVPGHLDELAKWKSIDIPFDIHAPHSAHGLNLSKIELKDENYKMYHEAKIYADELDADVIVFHGGLNGDYKETANQILQFNDKRIILENKPYRHINSPEYYRFIGSTYDQLEYIIDKSKCGFCLDIGHAISSANYQGIDQYRFINQLLDLCPKRIHLSDINVDSKFDQHLNFGRGNLDLNMILDMLSSDIPITIETEKKSKFDLNDYKNDACFLRSLIQKNNQIS